MHESSLAIYKNSQVDYFSNALNKRLVKKIK